MGNFRENKKSATHILTQWVNVNYVRAFNNYCLIWMKLSVRKLKSTLFSIYEFLENDKGKVLLFLWP
jgi:hypothetical protein